jgi:hypothetical protein
LEILPDPAGPEGDVPGEDGNAVLQDVHVGRFVSHVDEGDDTRHRLGIVVLERVVERERVHVDDPWIDARVPQEADLVVDQLALGRHQQDLHLQTVLVGIQDLEVQLDALDVERHMLLGLPPNHLTGIGLLHPIHLDLLDDHVVPADAGDHVEPLHTHLLEEPSDRVRHEPVVHDLALDDGIGKQRSHGHPRHLRLVAGVVHLDHLDEAGPDVQAGGSPSAPEESHANARRWED